MNNSQLKLRSEKFYNNNNNNNNTILVYWSRKQCKVKRGFMIFALITRFLSSYRLHSEASGSATLSPLLPDAFPCSISTHSGEMSKGTCITSINIRMHIGIDSFKTVVRFHFSFRKYMTILTN